MREYRQQRQAKGEEQFCQSNVRNTESLRHFPAMLCEKVRQRRDSRGEWLSDTFRLCPWKNAMKLLT